MSKFSFQSVGCRLTGIDVLGLGRVVADYDLYDLVIDLCVESAKAHIELRHGLKVESDVEPYSRLGVEAGIGKMTVLSGNALITQLDGATDRFEGRGKETASPIGV